MVIRFYFRAIQQLPKAWFRCLVFILVIVATHSASAQSLGSFRFDTVKIPDWPAIHSFAYAVMPPHVLIIGGRKDGIHDKKTGFEITSNNSSMYLWNTQTNQIIEQNLDGLPIELFDFLSASNAEFVQDSSYLYLMGGYAQSVLGEFKTYSVFARFDLKNIISSILTKQDISNSIKYVVDDTFAIAGGQLRILDSIFYLVGGHYFSGKYNDDASKTVQRYTDAYRMFSLQNTPDTFYINTLAEIRNDFNFHRRDFNLNPIIDEQGNKKLMVFSGVFQYNINRPFLNTALIDRTTYEERFDFDHKLASYTCSRIGLYDSINNEFHQVFFGGMAEYYRDSLNQIVQDPLVPFVKSVSCLTRKHNGHFEESLLKEELPGYFGTNSEILLSPDLPLFFQDIVDLNKLPNDSVFIGTLFGGIYNPTNERNPWEKDQAKHTISNPYLIKINYIPASPNHIGNFYTPKKDFSFQVNSNSATEKIKIYFKTKTAIKKASIWIQDAHGRSCYFKNLTSIENQQIELDFKNQMPATYFIRILANDSLLYGNSFQVYK
ncbi:MAG: hypothetical protein IPK91_06370 [Saprospiraceae bacterium]|nr:hypothetical protein [Saprospiraceae bacterium]